MRRRFRSVVALLIGISWLVLLVLMWRAYRTVPTAEQLADARPIRPPLPADLLANFLSSTLETAALLLLLWPQWARHYILRTITGLIGLVLWFFVTVPLDLNTMEWLHRRWLALMILVLLLIPFIYPFLERRSGVRTET